MFKWNIKQSSDCEKCGQEDSIEHTMYQCEHVQQLWLEFSIFIANQCQGQIFVVNLTEVILNCISVRMTHMVNFYCLVMKQIFYRHKCMHLSVNFKDFLREIDMLQKIEYEIAKSKNKIKQHEKKWTLYLEEQGCNDCTEVNIEHFINEYIQRL